LFIQKSKDKTKKEPINPFDDIFFVMSLATIDFGNIVLSEKEYSDDYSSTNLKEKEETKL